jgi:YD repeat-containing protein
MHARFIPVPLAIARALDSRHATVAVAREVARRFRAAIVTFLLLSASFAHGGTLVFPPTSQQYVTSCDTFSDSQASNPNGCGAYVSLHGGQFIAPSGGSTIYATDYQQGAGCADALYVSFTPYATDFTATITNPLPQGVTAQYSLDVEIHDYDPQTGFPVTTTTRYPLVPGQALGVSGAGYSIATVSFITRCTYNCSFEHGPGLAITAMAATQPALPTVSLSTKRNGDGTYEAVIAYSFSKPGTLSLSLLPTADESGMTYFTGPASGEGTTTFPLGSFDTDRTLEAVATACEGSRTAHASVSGCDHCKGPARSTHDPIRLYDGVMTYNEQDPLPVTIGPEFRRAYSSGAAADGRFGKGWSSIFDSSAMVVDAEGKTVVLVNEDRTRTVFRFLRDGEWYQAWPQGGAWASLTGSEAAGYTFRDANGSLVRTFGTNHRLTRLQDLRRGQAVSITYDASGNPTRIVDESGNWSCTITTSNNHVVGIAVDGRPDLVWAYGYNGSLLTSVSVAGAATPWRAYDYTAGRLSAVHDSNGAIIESHDYDAQGRAVSSYGPSGDLTGVQYGATDANGVSTTTATRADNSQETYQQAFTAGEVVTQHADGGCSSCGSNDATAVYDANGNLARLQNARGYVTLSAYDLFGKRRLEQTTTAMAPSGCNPDTDPAHCRLSSDALAAASLVRTVASQDTNYTYGDPNWPNRPTRITRNSVLFSGVSTETFTFDATTGDTLVHTMSGAIDSGGTQEVHITTTALYDGTEPAAFTPGGAFQSAWLTFPQPGGLKKSVDGPRTDVSDVTTFVYYPADNAVPAAWRGRLAAVRGALGHISRFQDYNPFGAAETVIDANGAVSRMTFDVMGRLLTSTVAGVAGCDTTADPLCATDLTTARTYSSTTGLLASEQRPAGNVTSYEYDTRGRLLRTNRGTATALERIEYAYDPTTGKKSSETVSAFENNAWVVK